MRNSLILFLVLLLSTFSFATDYYVKNGGNDGADGLSDGNAWETIAKVNSTAFSPTDTISFKRGSTWSGTELGCDNSGTDADNMITYQDYGSGLLPIIENTGSSNERCCRITADWVKVKNLHFNDGHYAGVDIASGSDRNIIEDCEITIVGSGVVIRGQYNLVDNCYIHDLIMVVNTPDPGNDDYGAVGVTFYTGSSYSEVRYCTFEDCRAPSEDYTWDGGVIEFFITSATTVTGVKFHHNWSTLCNGFWESGGTGGDGLIENVELYHNVGAENYGENSFSFHTTGGFLVEHDNIEIYNNTWVDSRDYGSPKYTFIQIGTGAGAGDLIFKNNVFYVDDWSYICDSDNGGWTWTHEYNCYERGGVPTALGFSTSTGEITQDPLFVNLGGTDYHLQSNSPCKDTGTNLGLTIDFDGIALPQGAGYDMGAYEYSGAVLRIREVLRIRNVLRIK